MKQKYSDIRAALELLQSELQRIGWWQLDKPEQEKLSSSEPFCVDTLTFSQWLQWIYLPKMHILLIEDVALPKAHDLYPIAQEAWKNSSKNTVRLMSTIHLLDEIMAGKSYQVKLQRLLNKD